jgi:hypothetical protein
MPAFFAATTFSLFGIAAHHEDQGTFQFRIAPHFTKEIAARHRFHIPIGNHQAETLGAHLVESRCAVTGVINIEESELPQQFADDGDHRVGITDN